MDTFFPRVVFSANDGKRGRAAAPKSGGRAGVDGGTHVPQRVIAVASGKGGVGKSVISANLGLRLAQRGRRVLLIDADLALANLDLMLGVSVRYTIRELLAANRSLEEVLVHGPEGVMLLPACSGDESFAELGHTDRLSLFEMIDTLDERFDTLIVDTGAGIGNNALGFAAAAEQVLIVVTPDPASIADAYAMVKALSRRGRDRFGMVVNLATNPAEAERVVDRMLGLVDQFLPDIALIPLGILYRDEVVLRAVRACEPVLQAFPHAGICAGIQALADRLLLEPVGSDSGVPSLFWRRLIDGREGSC